ncbi:glycosyltransferase [Sphingomonas xinjiangensis]|uniref:glycosyltransferase n=1 Tax=Sphingomonas xinjiangensis TaxID=643568 RepID=UPI00161FC069
MNTSIYDPGIPVEPWRGATIPRIIHQTYPSIDLPDTLAKSTTALKETNPSWQHCLYDNAAIERFIYQNYGSRVLATYKRINPVYGAARADLFRYLLIYKVGGVYLDIKSSFSRPLDSVLSCNEGFVVSRWSNKKGQRYEGFGIRDELPDLPEGELQQWHVIAAPGHPFLKAVIDAVLKRIATYRPWRDGTGKPAVLKLTGPVIYTQTILPLLSDYPCKIIENEQAIGLEYSVVSGEGHRNLFAQHYSLSRSSLVRPRGFASVLHLLWGTARTLKRR